MTQSETLLPLIVQAFYPHIAKSLHSGLWYEVIDGHIDIGNHLIGVDEAKYEQTKEEPGFINFKLKQQ